MNKRIASFITVATLLGCGQGVEESTSTTVAAVTLAGVTFVDAPGIADEHCRLPQALLNQIPAGRQVRLLRANPTRLALCTVDAVAAPQVDGQPPRAQMNAATLRGRFIFAADAGLAPVTNVSVSDQLAGGAAGPIAVQQSGASPDFNFGVPDVQEWRSQTIPSSVDRVIYTAPHGLIEGGTHHQVNTALEGGVDWDAGWIGMYRQLNNSAGWDQYHTTSTEISTTSFPGLGAMVSAGFRYAVSFHGFGTCAACGDVFVGGGEDATFRSGVAELLREVLPSVDGGAVPTVVVAPAGADMGGENPANYVNALAGGHGLQLEQSLTIRNSDVYRPAVATAVREYIDCVIAPGDVTPSGITFSNTTWSRDVSSYVAGPCPRAVVDVSTRAPMVSFTGEAVTCAVGARVHVDLFRRRADLSYRRIGGGYRVGVSAPGGCTWSNEPGYIVPGPADFVTQGVFRAVVRANDAGGALVPVRVRAST